MLPWAAQLQGSWIASQAADSSRNSEGSAKACQGSQAVGDECIRWSPLACCTHPWQSCQAVEEQLCWAVEEDDGIEVTAAHWRGSHLLRQMRPLQLSAAHCCAGAVAIAENAGVAGWTASPSSH
ncbi:hypothetical protein HaLaN_15036 [Haematococcus lacustris]|uniref:Uncharacterized protein n=1 Tax=Haematococcus lacustris TaxID=44745 RepID=A0A699Z6Q3_HAELA|nr:hypothetical protein HaLaN_15036 [Haematococcus lacustris]